MCIFFCGDRLQPQFAGAVLFGVADYVPALEAYIEKYGIDLKRVLSV